MIYKIKPYCDVQYINKIDHRKLEKALDIALEIRKFEIELYWERAKYFWAFTVTILASLAFLFKSVEKITIFHLIITQLLLSLMIIVNFAWYLANRGSKYWQENWEEHVILYEKEIIGPVYSAIFLKNQSKSSLKKLLEGAPFSVSKLNMFVSLVMFVFWIIFYILSTWYYPLFLFNIANPNAMRYLIMNIYSSFTFIILSLVCCFLMYFKGRFQFFDQAYRKPSDGTKMRFGIRK